MPDTSVKFFHSEMQGAPVLSGSAGTLIAVLDACLVNGFGLKTLTSLVVLDNVATMNFTDGHPFEVDTVALVAGATPAGLNGQQKITATTANSASFATSGIGNQTATGTISAKLAAAGWAKTYSGTNKAAYKSLDVQATADLLRVDDTGTTSARVVGFETMSDVDTGTGRFPTDAQVSGGFYWSKSDTASAAARKWMVFSDARMFYYVVEANPLNYPTGFQSFGFGDILPSKANDAYACLITGAPGAIQNQPNPQEAVAYSSNSENRCAYLPRAYTGIGTAANMRKTSPQMTGNDAGYQSGNGNVPYPNPADGGLYVGQMNLLEEAGFTFRGIAPGAYNCPQNVPPGQFGAKDRITGVTGLVGRTLYTMTVYRTTSHYTPFFFDVTGPWR
jgi:hypothetical protein